METQNDIKASAAAMRRFILWLLGVSPEEKKLTKEREAEVRSKAESLGFESYVTPGTNKRYVTVYDSDGRPGGLWIGFMHRSAGLLLNIEVDPSAGG